MSSMSGKSRPPVSAAPKSSTSSGKASHRSMDETEYLLSNPNNARRLLESVKQLNAMGGTLKKPPE